MQEHPHKNKEGSPLLVPCLKTAITTNSHLQILKQFIVKFAELPVEMNGSYTPRNYAVNFK